MVQTGCGNRRYCNTSVYAERGRGDWMRRDGDFSFISYLVTALENDCMWLVAPSYQLDETYGDFCMSL